MAHSPLRFGIITDIHYGNGDREAERSDLHDCFSFWQQNNTDFAVQLGDLIDGKGPEAVDNLKGVAAILREYPGKLYHVAGNHCLGAPINRYLKETGVKSPYYTFRWAAVRFVVLHGMDINPESHPLLLSDRRRKKLLDQDPWATLYCGAVGERQIHWLEQQLESARNAGEKVVMFCHFPLLKETSDEPHGLLWNHDEVTDVLCRYKNIIACFTGHLHRGAYFQRYGIHFMTMPPFIKRNEPPHYSCGMIELDGDLLKVYDQNLKLSHELPITL